MTSVAEMKDPDSSKETQKRLDAAFKRAKEHTRLTDKIANSTVCVRNWAIPRSKEFFPLEYRMHMADLYYPDARDMQGNRTGGLFIDVPGDEFRVSLCERKLKTLRENGIRYTYVKVGEGMAEAMARLGDKSAQQLLETRKRDQDAIKEKAAKVVTA